MKKRIAQLLCLGLAIFMLAGCGANEETNDTNNAEETVANNNNNNNDNLITLGEYKGIEVSYTPASVDETEVENYATQVIRAYMTAEVGITDRAVEDGDEIYLSYEGKIDGETFDGGTSSGSLVVIGSHTFIDTFESQLIGVMPGEEVEVNVTFPENYDNADLAGKPAVFTCNVQYIMPTEFTDEMVASLDLGYDTLDIMKEDIRAYFLSQEQSNIDMQIQNDIIEAAMNNASFGEMPSELVEKYVLTVNSSINSYASMYGVDADTFCLQTYGTDAQTMMDELSVQYAKQDTFFKAVAEAEGMSISDEDLDARLTQYATDNGYESMDDLLQAGMDKEEYRDYFIFDDVINFLVENAVITAE